VFNSPIPIYDVRGTALKRACYRIGNLYLDNCSETKGNLKDIKFLYEQFIAENINKEDSYYRK
jgi:hypothetical protein